MEQIRTKLDSLSLSLAQLEIDAQNSLQSNSAKMINRDISADELIFNKDIFINNLKIARLNNISMNDLYENALNITEGFELDEIILNSAIIDDSIEVDTINGHPSTNLIHTNEPIILNRVTLKNRLTSPAVQVEGKLNNLTVNEQTTLLRSGDQSLGILDTDWVEIRDLDTNNINGIEVETLLPLLGGNRQNVKHIKNLTVTNLVVGGYINDVDVPTLDKYALKKEGDQEITSKYIFDEIKANDLRSSHLDTRNLSELIPIDGGSYTINEDLIFNDTIQVNNLTVNMLLNGIDVKDGELDILLRNITDEQSVPGVKIFEDLVILNPINLHGKIKSEGLEKINPLVSIDRDLVLRGDVIVTGNTLIEDLFKSNDIETATREYSIKKLQDSGLKLTDIEIEPNLHFVQQLSPSEVFVDQINGLDFEDLVINGDDRPQVIQGHKTFSGDLQLTGPSSVFKMNNINAVELENNVMKIGESQTLKGKHHIKHLIVEE